MKVEDLTIGSWVKVNDIEHTHPLQVAEIFKHCGAYYATLYWDGMPDNVNPETLTADVDKVLPIPLTPEILEKNGFKKDKYGQMILDEELGSSEIYIVLQEGDECYWWTVNNELIAKTRYVHELQHIFRLCKIEKTIEL